MSSAGTCGSFVGRKSEPVTDGLPQKQSQRLAISYRKISRLQPKKKLGPMQQGTGSSYQNGTTVRNNAVPTFGAILAGQSAPRRVCIRLHNNHTPFSHIQPTVLSASTSDPHNCITTHPILQHNICSWPNLPAAFLVPASLAPLFPLLFHFRVRQIFLGHELGSLSK